MGNKSSFRSTCLHGFIAAVTSFVVGGGAAWSQPGDARAFQIAEPFLPKAATGQAGPAAWSEWLKEDLVRRLNAGVAPLLVTTTTLHGVYSITLQFAADRNAGETRRSIQAVLAAHASSAGLAITEVDAARIPVLSIVLSSAALSRWEVSDYAAHIQSRLAPLLEGVGEARLCRDMSVALMVHLDPSTWQRMGLKETDMHGVLGPAIARFGSEAGYAGITRKGDSYAIALAPGSARTADAPSLGNKQITLPDGRQLLLRDIAQVELGSQPTFDFCLYKGERAVILQVDLQWHAALDATLARLDQEVQTIYRDVPRSMSLTVIPKSATRSR
jgi:multidrug efflux pump subunit AcrB